MVAGGDQHERARVQRLVHERDGANLGEASRTDACGSSYKQLLEMSYLAVALFSVSLGKREQEAFEQALMDKFDPAAIVISTIVS